MPPTGQPTIDFSNVSNEDLSQMLKDYGVDVGPINVATRKTYERKLVQLKTGSLPPSSQSPVVDDDDDDDDDEEVQIRQPEALRRPVQDLSESTYSYGSSVSDSSFSASKSYASQSYGSQRHTDLSPDVRSRPSLLADRPAPPAYSTPLRRPVPTTVSQQKGNSIPLWLKLVAVAIAVILMYLIYINMEPAAVSSIPETQHKMEV